MYLGKRYEHCTFDSYELTEAQPGTQTRAKQRAIEYAGLTDETSLILLGNSGTGKDHLVESILKARGYSKAQVRVCEFELLSEVKRAAQKESIKWYDAVSPYVTAEMLVIRDFGIRGKLSDSQLELVYHVVNQRYDNMLPLIITTNLAVDDFKQAVDVDGQTRVYDRLAELTQHGRYVLPLTCESYRRRKRDN